MNKIFKVKRNLQGQFVVCSELTKTCVKTSAIVSSLALLSLVGGRAIAAPISGDVGGVSKVGYESMTINGGTVDDRVFRAMAINGGIATGTYSTAIGEWAEAEGNYSIAMGLLVKASGDNSTAMGHMTEASGSYSTATGEYTKATGEASTAMGWATRASEWGAVAMGKDTIASGRFSMAVGDEAKTSGRASIAMGYLSEAQGENSLAASGGIAKAANTIAMGVGATAELEHSIALGDGSVANTAAGEVGYLGTGKTGATWISTNNAISIGDTVNGVTRQLTGLAAGTADTDAVNVAQLKALQTQLAPQHYLSIKTTDANGNPLPELANFNNDGASGNYAVAIGAATIASGQHATAVGTRTTASGWSSMAMGESTTASRFASTAMGYATTASGGTSTAMGANTIASGGASTAMGDSTTASGGAAVAMGYKTIASGGTSTAMGYATTASGGRSTSMGLSTTASGLASTAMGHLSEAQGENSLAASGGIAKAANTIAMGVGATAELDNSIALGDGSVANTAAGEVGYLGAGKTGATWISTNNAISIGDAANGVTRQLTGLAAGTADTDAVNVAQLKAAQMQSVTVDLTSVANHFGGGSQVQSDGSISAPTYTITDYTTGKDVQYNNVGDALTQLNTNQNALGQKVESLVSNSTAALRGEINRVRRDAHSGTAAAMAVANLGQPYKPAQTAFGLSSAIYQGRVGMAAGLSRITESGKFLFKGAVNTNNDGKFGAAVSATYYFD